MKGIPLRLKYYYFFLGYDLIGIYCRHFDNKVGDILDHLKATA